VLNVYQRRNCAECLLVAEGLTAWAIADVSHVAYPTVRKDISIINADDGTELRTARSSTKRGESGSGSSAACSTPAATRVRTGRAGAGGDREGGGQGRADGLAVAFATEPSVMKDPTDSFA
jgi:hypothetical protein